MVHLRRIPSQTSYAYRYQALSCLEQMEKKRLGRYIVLLMAMEQSSDSPLPQNLLELKISLVRQYVRVSCAADLPPRVWVRPTFRMIDDFSESVTYTRFLFTREDMHRLHRALRMHELGPWVSMGNGSRFGTEELLCLGLNRIVFPQKFGEMVSVYGRDWTALSRAFNWFSYYVRKRFGWLVQSNLPYWKPMLEVFSEAIRVKVEEKSEAGIIYPPGGMLVAMMIDDTLSRSCRPGGGPAEEGEDAPRFNTLIQQAFYTGYKKIHGFKYQSCELPNGMCADLYGPTSIR